MKIALASKEFVNKDIQKNISTIIETMIIAKQNNADMLCFGEAFLQGFDSLSWDYESDKKIALKLSSTPIKTIAQAAKDIGICVSFGFIENEENLLYCSYVVINEFGDIIYNFKRVSPGWKELFADNNYYKEGDSFSTFQYKNLTFTVGLCGDFWNDTNIIKAGNLKKDITLWPLYVSFSIQDFESKYKQEYVERASKLNSRVLFINSLSKDPDAFGGCYEFYDGQILNELPFGEEGLLYVEV